MQEHAQTPAGTAQPDEFERHSDEDLKALIERATRTLQAREAKRRKEALEEIRQIARQHGLSVEVSDQPGKRKRGRPRKRPA